MTSTKQISGVGIFGNKELQLKHDPTGSTPSETAEQINDFLARFVTGEVYEMIYKLMSKADICSTFSCKTSHSKEFKAVDEDLSDYYYGSLCKQRIAAVSRSEME